MKNSIAALRTLLKFGIIFFLFLVACSSTGDFKRDNIPTIGICELARDASKYNGQIIRIHGAWLTQFEGSMLFDSKCNSDIWVTFDPSFGSQTDPKTMKKFAEFHCDTNEAWGNDYTIIAVGKFENQKRIDYVAGHKITYGFGHMNAHDCQFTILKLESIRRKVF